MTAKIEILINIDHQLATLPPDALRLVAELIGVISKQYVVPVKSARPARTNLRDEPFIGLWADRTDMEDSTAYVRKLRQDEWI